MLIITYNIVITKNNTKEKEITCLLLLYLLLQGYYRAYLHFNN